MDQLQKNEINSLIDELLTIKQNNIKNNICVSACNEALTLANTIKQGKNTNNFLLKITTHSGKMQGIRSLSTYKKVCDTCNALKNDKNAICFKCYANKQLTIYKQLAPCLIYNTLLLKYTKLCRRQLPVINDLYFRYEAFSDLQNLQHLQNLYAIARYNKNTQFTIWSKNYKLLTLAKAPKNINIVLSSYYVNTLQPCSDILIKAIKEKSGCKNIKFFTVYDKQHANNINCKKSCLTCLECYKAKQKTEYINEILK